MKIFNRDGKVNFVDENNVLVGFDYRSCCCEQFGYFFSAWFPTRLEDTPDPTDDVLNEYVFDTSFCQEPTIKSAVEYGDDPAAVVFRLTNGSKELFLTLHNTHNGYYSHGFEMEVGGTTIHSGSL